MDELELVEHLERVHRGILIQAQRAVELAIEMKVHVSEMRDAHGNFVFLPLITAEAQVLHALTLIRKGETTNVLNFINGGGEVISKSAVSQFFRESIYDNRSEDSGIDIPTVD